MNNIDRHAEIEIINALSIILQSHKYIKDYSNVLKRHGIDVESIIKEYDKAPHPSIPDLIDTVLKNKKN